MSSPRQIPRIEGFIKPGLALKCVPGVIRTPGNFTMIPSNQWNDLEQLQQDLQECYEGMQPNVEPGTLLKRQGIAARNPWDSEWHRAEFLESVMEPDGETTFKVELVDYGDIVKVGLSELRLLLPEHYGILKALSIKCVVKLGGYYNPYKCDGVNGEPMNHYFDDGEGWEMEDGGRLRALIFNLTIGVDFLERRTLPNGEQRWLVYLHLAGPMGQIRIPHLEREVVKNSRGFYARLPEETKRRKEDDITFHTLNRFGEIEESRQE